MFSEDRKGGSHARKDGLLNGQRVSRHSPVKSSVGQKSKIEKPSWILVSGSAPFRGA
jgi:hypothetical protein